METPDEPRPRGDVRVTHYRPFTFKISTTRNREESETENAPATTFLLRGARTENKTGLFVGLLKTHHEN